MPVPTAPTNPLLPTNYEDNLPDPKPKPSTNQTNRRKFYCCIIPLSIASVALDGVYISLFKIYGLNSNLNHILSLVLLCLKILMPTVFATSTLFVLFKSGCCSKQKMPVVMKAVGIVFKVLPYFRYFFVVLDPILMTWCNGMSLETLLKLSVCMALNCIKFFILFMFAKHGMRPLLKSLGTVCSLEAVRHAETWPMTIYNVLSTPIRWTSIN